MRARGKAGVESCSLSKPSHLPHTFFTGSLLLASWESNLSLVHPTQGEELKLRQRPMGRREQKLNGSRCLPLQSLSVQAAAGMRRTPCSSWDLYSDLRLTHHFHKLGFPEPKTLFLFFSSPLLSKSIKERRIGVDRKAASVSSLPQSSRPEFRSSGKQTRNRACAYCSWQVLQGLCVPVQHSALASSL